MNDAREVTADRDEGAAAGRPANPALSDAELMRQELDTVIASPDFARAPIMKRLLSFLVGETASGRGDQLKAYSVAVDGLGRAPDYDARADSYPRVQVGRLRRMLDNHYRTNQPVNGLRLTIPSGRYRVALRPAEEPAGPDAAAPPALPQRPFQFGWHIALLLLLVGLAAALTLHFLPMRTTPPNAGRERPILEIGGTTMAQDSPLGKLVRVTLINGLGRSDMFDVRPLRRSAVNGATTAPAAAVATIPQARYRLGGDLIGGEHPRLFLRLLRVAPDRLIWSGDISLGDAGQLDGEALEQRLAPMIATIGRVNGLIATHELQENGGIEAAGYSCLLLYHRYRKERTTEELRHVQACVEKSLKRDPDNAQLQAAAAQLAIEKMVSSDTDPRDRSALLLTARRHAQIAGSIDPLDAWGNAARARVAVARNACAQAVGFAIRASELQPYDPALLADAGVYLLDCDDPRAESLIRRAITLDDDPEGRFYGPLLLLAIARDDQVMAREALTHMAPPVLGRHALFFLTSAVGYAMVGDVPRARAAWAQLEEGSGPVARDPRGFLERIGYAAKVRERAMIHLRNARLIAN
ncbi:hypothetical protein GG804_11795 [Sphingomonas histidinilytica]|jgi:hypothetical protein|uniref:Adenylate cyclase n=1 Tax=Rhizorhabdus histidinilytica TaxID=439228 RepID=A0A1T5BQI3_9SPHN|nr:hypothetical protein [Rhizorhabdus histidinilytica]MBO9377450.1 hypothetical protein [Rhizorhabdus histidinilytica]QEH77543.1 hypothetical protein EIK56_04910 [Sphingomonas sp. C8-2]SKB49415.1 hypothetical protein SAMN06295920_103200 [Rhizorhabdus histidinilytica]